MSKKVFKFSKKSKVAVKVVIVNNPKNINKNKLINFDPDFTWSEAGGGGGNNGGGNSGGGSGGNS
ncbi:hypothetical protein PMSD_03465 [Paenibacillus macquariensis subsp. defensor]|nr:hypothetical protein PMSD_03465 [Paenibacillus macquariensis subsp. defensor]